VVAEEAEGDAIVGVQLGCGDEMLRRSGAEPPRFVPIGLLLRLRAAT